MGIMHGPTGVPGVTTGVTRTKGMHAVDGDREDPTAHDQMTIYGYTS